MKLVATVTAGFLRWLSLRFLVGADFFVSVAERVETYCPDVTAKVNTVQPEAVVLAISTSMPVEGEARLRALVERLT
jgi:hypothetical protein